MTDAVVSEYERLVQTFDLLRERHQVDVMQPGLLACVCGERLPIIYGADGQPAFNPIIRHHHEHYASAAAKRVAEFQQTALEMARKAEQAERRAEEAEFHVEQLRDARDSAERRIERAERLIDSWEHDAPDHSNPVFIGRLRECLRRDPAPVRLREGPVPENQVGSIADLHTDRCVMTEHSPPESGCDDECTGLCGDHEWLDRPESDTRECLICGTEVAG